MTPTPPAMNAASPTYDHEELREAVSDFRKATFEFAQGRDPDDHALMMSAQGRIFGYVRSLAPIGQGSAPADSNSPEFEGISQGSATSGEAVPIRSWQERRPGGKMDSKEEYMQAEIDDLRAALAAKAEQSNSAGSAAADFDAEQCIELAGELQREWARKSIAEIRAAATMMHEGPFRGGIETACDEIEVRMRLNEDGPSDQSNTPVPRVGGNTCKECGGKGYSFTGQIGEPPEECEACFDQSPDDDAPVAERAAAPASVPEDCTCPSGDGSLRWPCPAHAAPEVAQPVAPASVPTEALNALLERIDDAAESYERHGAICQFEGNPMLYAATLEEIITLRGEFHVASLAAPASVPDGWKLVPIEPTEAIMDAAEACSSDWPRTTWKAAWTCMLAAAPEVAQPATQGDLPTLPRELLNLIGEYGMARTDDLTELDRLHRWELLIAGIKEYAAAWGKSLATPAPTAALSKQEIARLIEQHTGMTKRQDERAYADLVRLVDAVLDADPAAGEPSAGEVMVVGHEFLKWNRAQTPPPVDGGELYIARKVLELRAAHIKATQGGKEQG